MSRVAVVINAYEDVTPRQTTAMLIAAAVAAGHTVLVAELQSLSVTAARETCFHVTGVAMAAGSTTSQSVAEQLQAGRGPFASFALGDDDMVLLRTNPGRDQQRAATHEHVLDLCCLLSRAGVTVANRPNQLLRFASKAALMMLPAEHRPEMVVSTQIEPIVQFVQDRSEPTIVKPLVGSRGADVLRVEPGDDLTTMLTETFAGRCMVAQEFLPAKRPGDQRVIVLDGAILKLEGRMAGIARRPRAGDFRGNLHAGGQAFPLELDESQIEAVECSAQLLLENGIRLAGVDVVGDKVIEFNVFSTGGLYDASRFANVDYCAYIVRQLVP